MKLSLLKLSSLFILLAITFLSFTPVYAQSTQKIKIKVVDERGNPILGAKVSIDNSLVISTNKYGKGEVQVSANFSQPTEVKATKKGLMVETWGYNKRKKEVEILMWPEQNRLSGRVIDQFGNPLKSYQVVINNINSEEPSFTDRNGEFVIDLPDGAKASMKNRFTVNGKVLNTNAVKFEQDNKYVTLRIRKETKNKTKNTTSSTKAGNQADEKEDENEYEKYKLPLDVVVFDNEGEPVQLATVFVDNQSFVTNEKGVFTVLSASFYNAQFVIDGYALISKNYDYKNNILNLYVTSLKSTVTNLNDTTPTDYSKSFNFVLNQLESRKQILGQKSEELRGEIAVINSKLENESSISSKKREDLEAYLHRLEDALIQNDVDFEDAQFKTKEMLDKMKTTILEKDSLNILAKEQIVEIKEQKDEVEKNRNIYFSIAIIMLVLFSTSFYFFRKNKTQKEELLVVNNDLLKAKDEILKAHGDILTIRDIGQKITATLDFETYITTIYASVNVLFDAPVLGVGIANEETQMLEFKGNMKDEEIEADFSDSFDDINKLSVLCFNNQEEVIINDIENEYVKYIRISDYKYEEGTPKSMLYLPLLVENKPVGVLTMQSYKLNAYKDMNMQVLNTLASYVAIAAANTNAYRVINSRNLSITNSMRYAQTIQDAILPTDEEMQKVLKNYFAIYKSKDIVSGDFYWMSHFEGEGVPKTVLAVVDCTGHGIPGAFMSMIGNTLLNEIVNHEKVYDPAKILKMMDHGVKNALKQETKGNTDGMDICLCILETQLDGTTLLKYAGAKRPLYYIKKKEGKIESITGDVKSVGGIHRNGKSFTTHDLMLEKGDIIYLCTDGMTDQNNPEKLKFGSIKFKELLENNATLPISIQKEKIDSALMEHQKHSHQRDDITVIGVKV